MFQIMSADDAVQCIQNGDSIVLSAFLAISNAEAIHEAILKRFQQTGSPRDLTIYATAGFGSWRDDMFAEPYVKAGAVRRVVTSHFTSIPATQAAIANGEIEGYCLPLGCMCNMLRGAARRQRGVLSPVGINLFVDPRRDGPGMNSRSTEEWCELVNLGGEELLYYKTPKLDVAIIRGTTCDPKGNISFEKECATLDAFTIAQAVKANGGTVIVQVERLSHQFSRPRNVIVPGALVDVVVVCPTQEQVPTLQYNPTISGDIHVPDTHMDYWVEQMSLSGKRGGQERNLSHRIIGLRAAQELKEDDIINIGIGVPEQVCSAAAKQRMLGHVTMTVESGAIGGLPAPGLSFGACIGADMVTEMSTIMEFYEGGGLDRCFMGNYQVDLAGNVNAHRLGKTFAGIGGFGNITYASKEVVFCNNFSTGGLEVAYGEDGLSIVREGRNLKFVEQVEGVSFSTINARRQGQKVMYVTERCVFELGDKGLKLTEVVRGIDLKRDILDRLPGSVEVADDLKIIDLKL